jgi:hypothetical protein
MTPELIAAKRKAIKLLRKHETVKNGYAKVIRRLSGCNRLEPCGSFACEPCSTIHQANFVRAALTFMRDCERRKGRPIKWYVISIVPYPLIVGELGKRYSKLPHEAKQEMLKVLQEAGLGIFIGALDFSRNEDHRQLNAIDGKQFASHWSVHLYGFVPEEEITARAERILRATFRRSNEVPLPVKILPFDGNVRALLYGMKPNFFRRVTVIGKGYDRKGNPRLCRNSRSRPLRPWQDASLRVVVNKLTLTDRLVLIGVKLRAIPSGFSLVLTRPP